MINEKYFTIITLYHLDVYFFTNSELDFVVKKLLTEE